MIDFARTDAAPALESANREVLAQLSRRGPVPVAALAGRWPVTRHHVRLVVSGLTREGLVSVVHRPPSRQPLVSLTPRGRAALERSGPEDGA